MGEKIMRKTTYLLLLTIIASLIIIATSGRSQEISSNNHEIEIISNDDGFSIIETITLQSSATDEFYENIVFWIDGNNVNIKIDENETSPTVNEYEYTINVTSMNIKTSQEPIVIISYTLNKNTQYFTKEIKSTTNSLSVTYDDEIIYSSEELTVGNSFDLSLIKQTETITNTITKEVEAPATMYYAIIIILVILLIISLAIKPGKKQASSKVKESANVSEELLNTKKSLLMTILKDIEKQHRAKNISDDTYHKLRDQYKQEAVITMKKIEDIKSKVK
jgi:hypothetical protein